MNKINFLNTSKNQITKLYSTCKETSIFPEKSTVENQIINIAFTNTFLAIHMDYLMKWETLIKMSYLNR